MKKANRVGFRCRQFIIQSIVNALVKNETSEIRDFISNLRGKQIHTHLMSTVKLFVEIKWTNVDTSRLMEAQFRHQPKAFPPFLQTPWESSPTEQLLTAHLNNLPQE